MKIAVKKFKQDILKIRDKATERSYYPIICDFLKKFAESQKRREVFAVPEESSAATGKDIGFPDITVRQKNRLVGWIEVKLSKDNLNNEKFKNQFTKYRDALENVLFTNLREWQLWQWNDKGKPIKVAEIIFDIVDSEVGSEDKLKDFLIKFFEGRPYEAGTPKQLALALARKTRLLSQQIEEAYGENSDLQKLKNTFEKTLIQNINTHQFANMMAETLAYSLFLAFLERPRQDDQNEELTLTTAIDYLPTSVPILEDLYSLVNKVSKNIPAVRQAAQVLIDQLRAADMARIHQKLSKHKRNEDPVIHFYEPFLKEYDPAERKARGVYYTPKEVVDYIVRSVDDILKNSFGKNKGLADQSVHMLDPATGTGTFLMSAIQEIYSRVEKENGSLGREMVKKEFNQIVANHILKHFYGFELLVAPYAVAHLKLTLLLKELGFNFAMTKNDNNPDNDRLKVYLANTLDDPNKPPKDFFGYDSISQESEKARKVKKDAPILAIIGNPPYSNFGQMNKGKWILDLLKDYKKGLKERKINIDDDFIKFIRFAQWKLTETGQGVFAMITSNTFIDGITHRQMRKSLMDNFDEIYIYNLHGGLRKNEVCPDDSKDENVFDIQQGVSINIFIKYSQKKEKTIVKYCDLWGLRKDKFRVLAEEKFDETKWKTLKPKEPYWFFVEKDTSADDEYNKFFSIADVFEIQSVGIGTKVDTISVDFNKNKLALRVKDILTKKYSRDILVSKYNLSDRTTWEYERAYNTVFSKNKIVAYDYRPFDCRWIFYDKDFLSRNRGNVMDNFYNSINLGFETGRTFFEVFCSSKISDEHFGGPKSYKFPLYLYPDKKSKQSNLLGEIESERKPNMNPGFIKEFSEKLGLKFISDGRGDLKKSFGPEDIFYYTYAVFHCPTYRVRYAEQLKIDFPRLPLTSDKNLFKKLTNKGNELVNLHLLGKNPFDQSKTIFDKQEKWGVKIGGQKPEDLDDWKVTTVRYDEINKRVYVNPNQYFEGVEKEVWEFMIGGYQVCEKWLKDRKKAERCLSVDDLKHYMKIIVSLRETIRIMEEIDDLITEWPMR